MKINSNNKKEKEKMLGTQLNYFFNSKNMAILRNKMNKPTHKMKTISMASMTMILPTKSFNFRNGKYDS